MSHRTLSLALHCSMSLSLHSLIILFKLPSIPRQMTNRFVALMISFFPPSNLYSILQSSSNKFQECKFFNKFIQNYSRYIYVLAASLFCEAEFRFPISVGKLSIKVKWKKVWKACFAFQSAHEEKYIGYFFQFIMILSSLEQGFNSCLYCIFSVLGWKCIGWIKFKFLQRRIFSIFLALTVKHIRTCISCKSKIYCKLITSKTIAEKKCMITTKALIKIYIKWLFFLLKAEHSETWLDKHN